MPDPQPFTDADRDELVAYLDGELDADGQQHVEARLGQDPHVRAEADTLRRAWEMLDYLPRPEPSQDFTERTLTRVSALRSTALRTAAVAGAPWYRQPAFAYAAWAAAVFVALALGYRLTPPAPRVPPPPPDPDTDPVFAREWRVIERLPQYLAVDNLAFLSALDKPDLFDDETLPRPGPDDDSYLSTADPERRARLQKYLAAYHRLSPEVRAQLRKLDQDLRNEDMVIRARLYGVMERYAAWLARLPEDDRAGVEAAPIGPERMDAIRDLLDEQWLASVPKGVTDIEKWRKDEADRRRVRQQSLRNAEEAALLLPAVQQQGKFREDVRKWVEEMLEPQLDSKEKKRLETAATKGPPYAYFHTVLVLSEAHRLKPPGLAAQWDRFREPRAKAAKAPG